MPDKLHLSVLCVTLDSHSATSWRNTWSLILLRIHISVLYVVSDQSPGTKYSGTWRVMLGKYCALCKPGTHLRRSWKVMLWIIHIHGLCASMNSSSTTTQRDTKTGIMGNSISLFCYYPRIWFAKENFLVQLPQEIFSWGSVNLGIPCYPEYAKHYCLLLVEAGNKLDGVGPVDNRPSTD